MNSALFRTGLLRSGLGLGLLGALWVVTAIAVDGYGASRVPTGTYDAIVVPGAAVRRGGIASRALRERTVRAVELWKAGFAPKLVLTGGVGVNPPSEASVAAALARELGVPEEALLLEDQSTSTEENARFTRERYGFDSVLVVTDTFHVLRCERIFGRHFARVGSAGSRIRAVSRLRFALREVAGLVLLGVGG